MHLTNNRRSSPLKQWGFIALFGLLAVGLWFGWFAWDTEYQYHGYQGTLGERTGPYEVWQGVGAFLCSLPVIALAYRVLRFWVALVVLPVSFTLAWISTASAMATGPLWVVGAIYMAFGTTSGVAIMLAIAAGIETFSTRRHEARRIRPVDATQWP